MCRLVVTASRTGPMWARMIEPRRVVGEGHHRRTRERAARPAVALDDGWATTRVSPSSDSMVGGVEVGEGVVDDLLELVDASSAVIARRPCGSDSRRAARARATAPIGPGERDPRRARRGAVPSMRPRTAIVVWLTGWLVAKGLEPRGHRAHRHEDRRREGQREDEREGHGLGGLGVRGRPVRRRRSPTRGSRRRAASRDRPGDR